ncbi:MAG TPA: TonB family protein [Puia sp.]|uniref:energy transducer TonB n=1 Tax=Puia sp. TaxID=2045100 RepID=UPI002BD39E19|nr:TonB family protein [Puia sp.]HVU94176.1 TonB family protein [Puia sp.]
MEANKILESSLIDVIFEGRNKAYGAYELRRHYPQRLLLSLAGVAVITGALFGVDYIARRSPAPVKQQFMVVDVQLEDVKEAQHNEPPPPPPPPKQVMAKVEITKFTPPKIVRDNEVKEDERPPEQEKLNETRIGVINQEGVKDEGVTAPPVSATGNGVVEAPKPKNVEDYDRTFTKVEIESEYPGGTAAWMRYLNKNFRYPEDAINNEIQGTVVVQFIVDKEGNVSNVEAVSGPETGGLRQEAIRVIERSGKWVPAIQNGRNVKSYKKQPVQFKLMTS